MSNLILLALGWGASLIVLGLLGAWFDWLGRRRRREQHPPETTSPSALPTSLPLSSQVGMSSREAERRRRAYAHIMADLKSETAFAAKVEAGLKELKVWTADDVEHRASQR